MPRVTEVLDWVTPPKLAKWYKENSKAKCDKIAEETSAVGRLVDDLIQQDIKEGGYVPPKDNEAVDYCLTGWELLKKEHPEFVPSVIGMQEEVVFNDITGHPDFICIDSESGLWGIADLKCTSFIRDKNWIQVAKYADLVEESRGYKEPSFLRIIRLSRDSGTYEWKEIKDIKMIRYCINLFNSYLALFNSEQKFRDYFRDELEREILNDTLS